MLCPRRSLSLSASMRATDALLARRFAMFMSHSSFDAAASACRSMWSGVRVMIWLIRVMIFVIGLRDGGYWCGWPGGRHGRLDLIGSDAGAVQLEGVVDG